MYSNLIQHIRRFVSLSDQEALLLQNHLKPVELKRKEFLLREGQVCRGLYFVEKGCLRMYFLNSKYAEQITQFALDGWWMTDYFLSLIHI
jgi:CRP-like cAMP-binding protein